MLLDFFRNSTLSLLFAFTCIICFTILLSGLQIDHLKCHPNAKLNCKIIQNNSMLYATVNSIVYQKGKFYFVVDDQKLLYCFRFEIKWGGLFITILLYRHILDSGIHMLSATFLVLLRVEFSKPKLKISITITKALKLRSFGASKLHMGGFFFTIFL